MCMCVRVDSQSSIENGLELHFFHVCRHSLAPHYFVSLCRSNHVKWISYISAIHPVWNWNFVLVYIQRPSIGPYVQGARERERERTSCVPVIQIEFSFHFRLRRKKLCISICVCIHNSVSEREWVGGGGDGGWGFPSSPFTSALAVVIGAVCVYLFFFCLVLITLPRFVFLAIVRVFYVQNSLEMKVKSGHRDDEDGDKADENHDMTMVIT